MRLRYNAPVILSFSLLCVAVLAADGWTGGRLVPAYFANYPGIKPAEPVWWLRLASHAMGHKNWSHLTANLSVILLIGPVLEEKYGSWPLARMMAVTALATGALNCALFPTGLLGASGLAFMMVILGSFTNYKSGDIPLTFLLVLVLFVGKEVVAGFGKDDVSHFAHILGGLAGAAFGFYTGGRKAGARGGGKRKAGAPKHP